MVRPQSGTMPGSSPTWSRVLDVYASEHTEEEPLICMDEAAKQMTSDVAPPIAPAPGRAAKEDYHYERHGVRAIFLFFDPMEGKRRVSCRDSRTRSGLGRGGPRLLDEDYPNAKRVKLVCDNLNTHSIASLYEAFPAEEAHRLARRLEIIHTPRSGKLASERGGDRIVGAGRASAWTAASPRRRRLTPSARRGRPPEMPKGVASSGDSRRLTLGSN